MGFNLTNGTISNCYSTGDVSGGDDSEWLGGLVGYNEGGSISNCYSTGAVTGGTGSEQLGGLVGYNGSGNISNCYSTGNVTGGLFRSSAGWWDKTRRQYQQLLFNGYCHRRQ